MRRPALPLALALLAAFLSSSTGARAFDPPAGDAARLQGTWVVVSGERDGKAMDASHVAGRQVVIEGYSFTDMVKGKEPPLARGTFTLDGSHTPRWIDARFTTGELSGKSCKAIYEIDGDTLRVVTAVEGDDQRPTEFKSQPATGQMMFVYRRAR
jgi:uncharacterized protein (TIGR03067 family)